MEPWKGCNGPKGKYVGGHGCCALGKINITMEVCMVNGGEVLLNGRGWNYLKSLGN